MKVGILTYNEVHNHGAVLQANALRTIILSMGYECEFLEFDRDYSMIPQQQTNKYKISIKSIPFYLKYMCKKGIGNIVYNIKKKRVLNDYRGKRLPLGGKYDLFQGDIVVIGSDEVFSLEIGVNPFLYGNDIQAKKIISYAGCFGPTTVQDVLDNHMEEMISQGFNKMNAISVRDVNSQLVVKEIAKKDAKIVCDPVILYGYEKEMKEYIPPYKDYLVIYSYDKNMNDAKEIENIREYANKNKLKIFSVGYYHKWCENIQATPNELLGWIKHARVVITDTFHGSVLSIICNTPMVVKVRNNSNKLAFLLEEYGLSERIMEDFKQLQNIAEQDVNFDKVNEVMGERRKYSMDFLINALKG